jgi:hypothetical protein
MLNCWIKWALPAVMLVGGICDIGFGETIVVIRHGDRDRSAPDNPLLPAGENRSRWIGRLLQFQQVDHIYYARNEDEKPRTWLRVFQTADGIYAGLAGTGDTPAAKPAAMPDGEDSASWLMSGGHIAPTDHVDIVVLHHEQIPNLVNKLIGPDQPPIPEIDKDDYNNVYILTRQNKDEKFTLVRLSLTPPPATQPSDSLPASASGPDAGLSQ